MSSLLQFTGQTSPQGVRLEAYLIRREWTPRQYPVTSTIPVTMRAWSYSDREAEPEHCGQCGKEHPKLYGFWRKPKGMFGHWVVFQYNGEDHAPDLSIPISLERLPKDAKPLSLLEWHRGE